MTPIDAVHGTATNPIDQLQQRGIARYAWCPSFAQTPDARVGIEGLRLVRLLCRRRLGNHRDSLVLHCDFICWADLLTTPGGRSRLSGGADSLRACRRSRWNLACCAREHALGAQSGCVFPGAHLPAQQKSLVQVVRSNLRATTLNTRFYPLRRPLLLQCSFGIRRLTPPRLLSMNFWQPASMLIWSEM